MKTYQHKIISVIMVTVATYFGFQSLDLVMDLYQPQTYWSVSLYVFLFHIFWLAFVFDLHLKTGGHWARTRVLPSVLGRIGSALASRLRHFWHWDYLAHYLNYLILPSAMYWSVIVLMFLNPFHALFKDGLIIVATAALSVAYWYFKEAFSASMEHQQLGLKVLALVKIFAAYLFYSALLAVGWYYGLPWWVILIAAFVGTALLVRQALFQHRLINWPVYPWLLGLSALQALLVWVLYEYWGINYYSGGLLAVTVYNLGWGLLHKHLERSLTRQLVWDYTFFAVVVLSLVLATYNYQGHI